MFFLSYYISSIGVLLSIAFFTLVERKIMGTMQIRKGPNKILLYGILQPISDAAKLLTKENMKMKNMKILLFFMGPMTGLFILLMSWMMYESSFNLFSSKTKMILILMILSLTPYMFVFSGWSSKSKYSIMGNYRAISQMISYEVCISFFILMIIYLSKTTNTNIIMMMQENMWFMNISPMMFFLWMTLCLSEVNRTPFDLSEGESEIVSGFNIEYGGGFFTIIFITEYGMILFMSFISSILLMSGKMLIMKMFFISIMFIWVRSCFPRMRYDNLMMLCWKKILPLTISLTMALMVLMN